MSVTQTVYHAGIPVDLAAPSRQQIGASQFFFGDNRSHVFTALVGDTDHPETGLRSGAVTGAVLRKDGTTVVLAGEKGAATVPTVYPNGKAANATACSVTLPQECFAIPGPILITIKLVDGETVTSVLNIGGTVIRTETDSAVDPGEIIPDVSTLAASARAALAAAEEANTAAAGADTAAQAASSAATDAGSAAESAYAAVEDATAAATEAYDKAQAANTAAQAANTAATAAGTAAQAAGTAATAADTAATAAAGAAQAANTAAQTAGTAAQAADTAATAANTAATSATSAAQQATTAASDANAAAQAATPAAAAANTAATAANTAATAANTAATAATTAADAANEAADFALDATNQATYAASQANQAASTATTAASSATTAAQTANTAAAAAQTAMAGAVRFDEAQTLTAAQQIQARGNIGAADTGTETSVYELLNRPMTWAVGTIGANGQPKTSTTRVRAMNIKCPYGAVLTCDPSAEFHMVYHNTDQSVLRHDPESGFYHDATYTIPAGSIISILAKYYDSTGTISDASPFVDLIRVYHRLPKDGGVLKGKKLSVLGDSISSYAGYIPSGADAQYTGSNNGVTTVNQMWWKVLCDVTGMVPLVINGWSGSGVTDLGNPAKTPMSDPSRTSNLGTNDASPDIIIIEGGSNDFMSAISAKNEPGSWDGKTAAQSDNSFTETYAQMVRAIQTNYPNAVIVALSTCFTNHSTLLVNNGYCWTRTCTDTGNVHTAYEYNEAIRKVAGLLHIGYIDVYGLGENDDNQSNFLADGVHPNRFGMVALAMRVAHFLPEQVSALLEGWLSRMTGF